MTEWGVYWQAIAAIATVLVGTYGVIKIRHELKRLNEQRAKEIADAEVTAKLKRTEFFLDQHRRLFDNEDLFKILCLIDDDSSELAKPEMWDQNRKFLAFLEEIALLVRSNQIDKDVAYYMFGYYAICAKTGLDVGNNLAEGIITTPEHWGLLFDFASDAQEYFRNNPNGPPKDISL